MSTTASPRLDRAGRILVVLGSLGAVVFVALPAFLFALFVDAYPRIADDYLTESQTLFAAVTVLVGVVAVTIVMMLRGGTAWLMLGFIFGLIVASAGFVRLVLAYQQGEFDGMLMPLSALWVAVGFALALGAAFRLIARRQAQGRG